jgi:hypothetical protein
MQRMRVMCRRGGALSWLGAALAVWLLLAESVAVAHDGDSAAHANGQVCAVCVAAASFGAGNVAAPLLFHADALTVAGVGAEVVDAPRSILPERRYARGPPRDSFSF